MREHAERVPSRTQSVSHRAAHRVCFSAPEVFIHSVARRTREHTKCVPSRRSRSPLWKRAGRERTPHPFCDFPIPRLSLPANRQHNRNTQTRVCAGTSTDRLCLFPRLPAIPNVKPFPTDAVRRSSILLLCFCFCFCFRFCFCLCFGTFRIRWYTVVYGRMHWGATACHGVRSYALGCDRMPWGTVVYGGRFPIIPYRSAPLRIHKSKKTEKLQPGTVHVRRCSFLFSHFRPEKTCVSSNCAQKTGTAPWRCTGSIFSKKRISHCILPNVRLPRNGQSAEW